MYVLLTSEDYYIVEYLFNELALTKNISEAKVLTNFSDAETLQGQIFREKEVKTSINTFIQ